MPDTYEKYKEKILRHIDWTLTETNLPYPNRKVGKVRDRYDLGNGRLLFVTTDRQSAFDRVLASIPFKGQVLNMVSAWWFARTKDIIGNHLLSTPDPCVTISRACTVLPIEFVVRGYITGSTDTSLWTHYKKGERTYCGVNFPDGLKKNQKLEQPVITPTTKEDAHDRPISPAEIIEEGWLSQNDWDEASAAALALFRFGTEEAAKKGLILVDTKYEFGRDADGILRLIDEIHTPDSSRYWLGDSYENRFATGHEPENIDKEFLRLWFTKVCDPYKDEVLPPAPMDLVAELSTRYIRLYEMITGEKFIFPDEDSMKESPYERLTRNLSAALEVKREA
ncbi:phosphoribosylaminoimidazolesuccinocarboxamide synthase [Parasphaerochaeta coccoides]|uniref:Phosphoribosylaminoimidazole-succinocarboxamide synthase n=1 Tax=Parasphaerochaeta coccoides (strain ATCC BAA-1237 / DSM 17374 / SPN1) TaxID=760011 RepID=F4GHX1_PARC1|nr:phosphoribosylaminoimidazolesuccinocarboxamide synthase [Parasphaerochaeta coccoides]AEC02084.1 phosphoribosylaminoimidazole-succinocarboxamide synthase [Parasphaerochaeta coccoides DSM 17374]